MTKWEYKALAGSPTGMVEAENLASATEQAHGICGPAGCEYVRKVLEPDDL